MMRTLHVGIRVADLDRSLSFYATLGYDVIGRVPETPLGELVMLKLPGDEFVTLELVHDPQHLAAGDHSPLSHLVIKAESMDDMVAELRAAGFEVDEPTSPDGSPDFVTAMLADPDGNRIELVQWPPGHADGMSAADFPDEPATPTPDGHDGDVDSVPCEVIILLLPLPPSREVSSVGHVATCSRGWCKASGGQGRQQGWLVACDDAAEPVVDVLVVFGMRQDVEPPGSHALENVLGQLVRRPSLREVCRDLAQLDGRPAVLRAVAVTGVDVRRDRAGTQDRYTNA
jgi:lactoylglutathione lyase